MIKIDEMVPLRELIRVGFTFEQKVDYLLANNTKSNRLTKGLFWEGTHKDDTVFTLQDCRPLHYQVKNERVKYDLKQLYLGCDDITEHDFVAKFMWDEDTWKRITSSFLKKEIVKWREELERRKQFELVSVLEQDALDATSKTSTASAKYLLEKMEKAKRPSARRGRPPKEEEAPKPNVMTEFLTDSLSRVSEFKPKVVK